MCIGNLFLLALKDLLTKNKVISISPLLYVEKYRKYVCFDIFWSLINYSSNY